MTDLERFRLVGNELAKFAYSPARKIFIRAKDIPTFMDTQNILDMAAERSEIRVTMHADGVEVHKV